MHRQKKLVFVFVFNFLFCFVLVGLGFVFSKPMDLSIQLPSWKYQTEACVSVKPRCPVVQTDLQPFLMTRTEISGRSIICAIFMGAPEKIKDAADSNYAIILPPLRHQNLFCRDHLS